MLKILKTLSDDNAVLALEGRLDTVTSPDLEKEIVALSEDVSKLVLDFEQLTYVSSAGLRVLLIAQKLMDKRGGMKIVHVNADINEILEITGFADILTIE